MSDDRRNTVDSTAPLTHADAEALISARLDGPIDPVSNRALLAHLSTCDSCRAFASEMDVMATAFRDYPSLPPSAAVTRAVRAEIRNGGSPMRKFSRWVKTSRSAPVTALAGAAVALALVATSVFGTLRDDNDNNPSVGAPGVAMVGTSTESAKD
ncbi:MAG: zf-HC2 domain-containing protein, partial [Thermomicrobiales bacterium]